MNFAALPPRLAEKIQPEPNSGCWIWRGAVSSSHRHEGYGSVKDGGSSRQAHLVIWEHLHGPLPPETPELDHVKERCSSKLCVNDAHLEPVTRSENNRRSSCHHHLGSHGRRRRPRPAAALTNMAIAFGIAIARSKPTWVHKSTPAAALAAAGGDGWTTGLVDLDPRRWRRS